MAHSEAVVIPTAPPVDFAHLIHRERKELLDLLATLEGQEWFVPTTCPGWSVLDLAVHLLGDDLGLLARDRDRYWGTAPPDEVESEADFVSFIDQLNERWVHAGRRLSPRLTMELLRWTGPQLVDLYRQQDPAAVTASVSWASDRPVPKWLDQGRELTERWVHHQQIRHGLGHPSWLEPEITGAVLDVLSLAYPFRLAEASRPAGTSVAVRVTGTVSRFWHFITDGDRWIRAEGPDGEEPSVALTVDADAAWRLLTNGLSRTELPTPEKDQDPELSRIILRTRAIIGLPDG